MVGPLKKGPGGFTHHLIAVDKFTKWIEAKPITNIRSEEAVKFFLDIIYRHRNFKPSPSPGHSWSGASTW